MINHFKEESIIHQPEKIRENLIIQMLPCSKSGLHERTEQ